MNGDINCLNCEPKSRRYTLDDVRSIIEKEKLYQLISNEYINFDEKLIIKHIKCGNIFNMNLASFKNGQRCPNCSGLNNSKFSKGSLYIKEFLDENDIKYQMEKKFNNCKNKSFLPFDYYIPKFNLVIEFDGSQHFSSKKSTIFTKERVSNIKINDNIKNEYCISNNIYILRIPYNSINYIKEILSYVFFQKGSTTIENCNFIFSKENNDFKSYYLSNNKDYYNE